MVIVKLIGGLGNQMFQYAMARRVAYVNNVPLKLDVRGFQTEQGITPRQYELDVFNIKAEIAAPEEIGQLLDLKSKKNKLNQLFIPYYKQIRVAERHFQFDSRMLQLAGDVYLEGFWQSEKYFSDIENVIRNDLTIKNEPDDENKKIIQSISQTNSVSVHFRRGDYITDPTTNQYHGVCSLEYYQTACGDLKKKLKDIHLFIFSDDPDWVRDNFQPGAEHTFISHNLNKNFEDLRLMSLCKHHIIANSSFSWWGTWLGKKPGQIVYAPKKWRNVKCNTKDLLPDYWNII